MSKRKKKLNCWGDTCDVGPEVWTKRGIDAANNVLTNGPMRYTLPSGEVVQDSHEQWCKTALHFIGQAHESLGQVRDGEARLDLARKLVNPDGGIQPRFIEKCVRGQVSGLSGLGSSDAEHKYELRLVVQELHDRAQRIQAAASCEEATNRMLEHARLEGMAWAHLQGAGLEEQSTPESKELVALSRMSERAFRVKCSRR